jgi:lipopolysaccharide/colanic/teichoic acid biosynthesis glycosyltransferase
MQIASRLRSPQPSAPPAMHHHPAPPSASSAPPQPILASPTASRWALSGSRRMLDIAVAALTLAACAAPMLVIALLIRLTSPGPAFFRQLRVGRGGTLFLICKFRSMSAGTAPSAGVGLTRRGDRRITPLGHWLRRFKLDELPQFFNVLRGEMSLVGPRPKLPQYTTIREMPYRPGITGAATLAFRREEEILGCIHPAAMEPFYHRHIKPLKARIDARYMCRATFLSDLRIIAATILACIVPAQRRRPARVPAAQTLPVFDHTSIDSCSASAENRASGRSAAMAD